MTLETEPRHSLRMELVSPSFAACWEVQRACALGAPPVAVARSDHIGSTDQSRIRDEAILGLAWTSDGRGLVFSSSRGRFGSSFLQKVSLARRSGEPIGQPERLAFGQGATDPEPCAVGPALVLGAVQGFRDLETSPRLSPIRRLPCPTSLRRIDEQTPDYSPDGKRLTFGSTRSGSQEIWIANADGSARADDVSRRSAVLESALVAGRPIDPVRFAPRGIYRLVSASTGHKRIAPPDGRPG